MTENGASCTQIILGFRHSSYIDFQKAFETVWQGGLWAAMRHLGYQDKIVKLLQAVYQISTSALRAEDDITD